MLIIHRIVEHLQDRQKITVIPPFNSPAKFGGSRALSGQSQCLLAGCDCPGSPAHTPALAFQLQDRTHLLTFSQFVIKLLCVFALQCLLNPRKLCPLSHLRRGRTSPGESLSRHQRSKTMISRVRMKVPLCRSFARCWET